MFAIFIVSCEERYKRHRMFMRGYLAPCSWDHHGFQSCRYCIMLYEVFFFRLIYLSNNHLSGLLLAVGLASAGPLSSPGSPRFLDLSSSPLCQGLFFLPMCQQSPAPAGGEEAARFVDLCSGPLAGLLPLCQNDTPANREESLRILNNLPICNGPLAGFIPFCQSTDTDNV